MSAFEVSETHIDVLITAGLAARYWALTWGATDKVGGPDELSGLADRRRLTSQSAGRVGAMLLAENQRSVNHLYGGEEWEPVYEFRRLPGPVNPLITLKALDCYEYQSCEHDGWRASEARAFCAALRREMIRQLPGYNDAPWEIGYADRDIFVRHVDRH